MFELERIVGEYLINIIFQHNRQLAIFYRVLNVNDQLLVRASSQHTPPLGMTTALKAALREKGFGIAENEIALDIQGTRVRAFEITEIPARIMQRFTSRATAADQRTFVAAEATIPRPENVPAADWLNIDKEIKARWNRFNLDMQQHILACYRVNLASLFDQLGNQNISMGRLGQTFASPIIMEAAKIPVRLPNSSLQNGRSNEVYDLLEVLKFEQRDPHDRSKRLDPITRNPFSLSELISDQQALQELQTRAQRLLGIQVPQANTASPADATTPSAPAPATPSPPSAEAPSTTNPPQGSPPVEPSPNPAKAQYLQQLNSLFTPAVEYIAEQYQEHEKPQTGFFRNAKPPEPQWLARKYHFEAFLGKAHKGITEQHLTSLLQEFKGGVRTRYIDVMKPLMEHLREKPDSVTNKDIKNFFKPFAEAFNANNIDGLKTLLPRQARSPAADVSAAARPS